MCDCPPTKSHTNKYHLTKWTEESSSSPKVCSLFTKDRTGISSNVLGKYLEGQT